MFLEKSRSRSNRPKVKGSRSREMRRHSTAQRVGAFQLGSGRLDRRCLSVPIDAQRARRRDRGLSEVVRAKALRNLEISVVAACLHVTC